MHPLKSLVLGAAASVVAGSSAVSASTAVVHPGHSIQAAVDAAAPGDTILVRAGTYHESVTIHTDGLTLRALGEVTLKPPYHDYGQCYVPGEAVGICVVSTDSDPSTGTRVRDVTISGFRIVGFQGDGVFGFDTENLKVSHVVAINNSAYGIASFEGIGTTFTRNAVTGSHDAGIYVGDSLTASAVVTHNRSWGNALGILVRHAREVFVAGNIVRDNCLGIFLLADGQAGGSGDNAVVNNTVNANNDVCTQFDEADFLPVLGGGGIVLAGSQHNTVLYNRVRGNQGNTIFSGGIVLVATTRANSDMSLDASTHNFIILNRSHDNTPADIVQDQASAPNVIVGNRCRTSLPDGLCSY